MHIYADCSFMACDFGEHGTLQVCSCLAIVNVLFKKLISSRMVYNLSLISGRGTRKCTNHYFLDSMNIFVKKSYGYIYIMNDLHLQHFGPLPNI